MLVFQLHLTPPSPQKKCLQRELPKELKTEYASHGARANDPIRHASCSRAVLLTFGKMKSLSIITVALLASIFANGAERYDGVTRTLFYASDANTAGDSVYLSATFDSNGLPKSLILAPEAKVVKNGWQFYRGILIEFAVGKAEVAGMRKVESVTVAFSDSARSAEVADSLLREDHGLLMFSALGLSSDSNISWISWNPISTTVKYAFAEKAALQSVSEPRVKFENVLTIQYSPKQPMPQIAIADSIEMTLPSSKSPAAGAAHL